MSKSKKRPYWQDTPCPEWCDVNHRKHDSGPDRNHMSEWSGHVTMSLLEPRRTVIHERVYYTKPNLELYLEQGHREVEPKVVVATETEDGIGYLKLTVAEALKLIKALTTAVDTGEGHANPGRES